MESRHICQGEPKGLLSGDSVPSSMCDIEACLCLTHSHNQSHPPFIFEKSHPVLLALPLSYMNADEY